MLHNRNQTLLSLIFFLSIILLSEGCVSKKRKTEVSKLSKFYHNVTSEYNGYFNANELMQFAMVDMQEAHQDNYTQVLELYDYINLNDPKMVAPDMDKAIEKVTRVATLHEKGDWVDDCYVLMGKAQYYKQDYLTSIETFEYFEEDFNPANPNGRNFQKKKVSAKAKKKQREAERKAEKKKRDDEKKAREKARKEEQKKRKEEAERRKKELKKRRSSKDRKKRTTTTNTPQDSSNVAQTTPITTNQPESDKPATPPAPIKDPEDKTAYNEGLVWLAMAYNRAGKYTSSEFLINRLEKKTNLKKRDINTLMVAKADNLIKTKKYNQAIEVIDELLASKVPSRNEKGRYAFVAGQLMMKDGYYADAEDYFEVSRKKSKNFKMKFMAKLNEIKCSSLKSSGSRNVAGSLEKMLKEEKYAEFRDEIYFALGEVAINDNQIEKGKEYFAQAVAQNTGNKSLKTEAYYQLATISYNLEKYVDAKLYYDTTLTVIADGDMRKKEIEKNRDNLEGIAKNITLINELDSLITMSSLSKDELMAIAKKRKEAEEKSGVANKSVVEKNLFVKGNRARANNSDFWAYNMIQKETGKTMFTRTWGDRPLADNWRLSSKVQEDIAVTDNTAKETDQASEPEMSEEEYNRLMADVPSSALAKGKIESQIRDAMFELGKQFRDKIKNYKRSAETLEQVNSKFPTHKDLLDSYYYLYLDYKDLDNPALADKYRNLILSDYPESTYGKLIENPAFANELDQERKKIDKYYDQTYEIFQNGDYAKVTERVETAKASFGKENKLVAKFSLLNAMALGYTEGQKAYIKGLNEVVANYPNTPEELKAKEIIRLLSGDKTAFEDKDVKTVNEMFTSNDEMRHYGLVIVYSNSDDVLQDAKIAVSEFNKKYHGSERLQMSDQMLNMTENTQLILVRSFPNKEKGMEYYESVSKKKGEYIPQNVSNYDLFIVSQTNYRMILQQKTHSNYKVYFEENYLKK